MKTKSLLNLLLLFLVILLSGCATVQDRITQVEQHGIEKIYNYPYKKVFYACEDVAIRTNWTIQESNFDQGYIYLISVFNAAIKIKKIDDNKTLIKILEFHSLVKKDFYKDFFQRLNDLLNRE